MTQTEGATNEAEIPVIVGVSEQKLQKTRAVINDGSLVRHQRYNI